MARYETFDCLTSCQYMDLDLEDELRVMDIAELVQEHCA